MALSVNELSDIIYQFNSIDYFKYLKQGISKEQQTLLHKEMAKILPSYFNNLQKANEFSLEYLAYMNTIPVSDKLEFVLTLIKHTTHIGVVNLFERSFLTLCNNMTVKLTDVKSILGDNYFEYFTLDTLLSISDIANSDDLNECLEYYFKDYVGNDDLYPETICLPNMKTAPFGSSEYILKVEKICDYFEKQGTFISIEHHTYFNSELGLSKQKLSESLVPSYQEYAIELLERPEKKIHHSIYAKSTYSNVILKNKSDIINYFNLDTKRMIKTERFDTEQEIFSTALWYDIPDSQQAQNMNDLLRLVESDSFTNFHKSLKGLLQQEGNYDIILENSLKLNLDRLIRTSYLSLWEEDY